MRLRERSPMFWLLVAALLLVGGYTTFHVVRAVRDFVYWNIHADEPIERWMTVGFVAHSYHLPPHVLRGALGLPMIVRDRRTLAQIAKAKGVSFATVKARLEYAIVHSRPPYPPPAPPPKPTPPKPDGNAS